MLEWSCQLHNAFRFDCAICSVIASHDGFTKKKNFSMDDVLYHYGTVIAHSMNGSSDHTSRSKHKRKMRYVYIQKYHIYKHDMSNHLFVDVSIYLLVYLSIYVFMHV